MTKEQFYALPCNMRQGENKKSTRKKYKKPNPLAKRIICTCGRALCWHKDKKTGEELFYCRYCRAHKENGKELKVPAAAVYKKVIDAMEGEHQEEEKMYSAIQQGTGRKAIEAVREFSLEVFVAYFKHNGFGIVTNSWMPTAFSTLPPVYRVVILKRYYASDNSIIVIDKLSKAYTKAGLGDEANEFLKECYDKKELDMEQYGVLLNDVELLKRNLDKLPIANDLETAKNNFNSLIEVIPEENRDSFICLISTILNGYNGTNKSK